MKRILLSAVSLLILAGPALSAEPNGEWVVEDGNARIRIEKCDNKYWGAVAWERTRGGVDSNNPDPSKRNRPTLGLPILLGMQATRPNRWDGEVYNAENGKTYTANITLTGPNTLRIEGCVLGGLFCGGQTWNRHTQTDGSSKPGSAREFCSAVLNRTGTAHQGRLK